jgi:hypothetical protein
MVYPISIAKGVFRAFITTSSLDPALFFAIGIILYHTG